MAASFHLPYSCSLMVVAADDAVGDGFGVGAAGAAVDAGVDSDVAVAVAAAGVDVLSSR